MIYPVTGYIRVKAVCLFTKGSRMLAIDGFDPTTQQRFWVPVGGRVELGETSRDAVRREVREELAAEVTGLKLLGVLENRFIFDGGEGHEVLFVYDALFVDESMYGLSRVDGVEEGHAFKAYWIDPASPDHGRPLYPDGLLDLLPEDASTAS